LRDNGWGAERLAFRVSEHIKDQAAQFSPSGQSNVLDGPLIGGGVDEINGGVLQLLGRANVHEVSPAGTPTPFDLGDFDGDARAGRSKL
jgi:hypothetical protein